MHESCHLGLRWFKFATGNWRGQCIDSRVMHRFASVARPVALVLMLQHRYYIAINHCSSTMKEITSSGLAQSGWCMIDDGSQHDIIMMGQFCMLHLPLYRFSGQKKVRAWLRTSLAYTFLSFIVC